MTKVFKWLIGGVLALLLVIAALAFALQRWVGTDDFRQRVAREASAALGAPVVLGSIGVDVWPLPALALGGIDIQIKPPLTLGRVEVRPQWWPLLQGRLVVNTLIVRQAVLPQKGIDALLLALQKKKQPTPVPQGPGTPDAAKSPPPVAAPPEWLPRRTVLEDVRWISAAGSSTAFDAEALLGADGLPDSAALTLIRGNLQGLKADLKRASAVTIGQSADPLQPSQKRWAVKIAVGGGTVEGQLAMLPPPAGAAPTLVLQGELTTRGVEVSALTAPNRSLSGLLEASTSFSARAATTAGLVDALQTRTAFTVRNATLNGIDLAKAVKTVGMSRGGETKLQTLAGQVNSQGRAAQLTNLVASSGVLSASGQVAVSASKALSGRITVDLSGDSKLGSAIGGAVGVPLVVGGTLDAPEVTLSRSALLGAAIGTVLLPGVGTGAGATLGGKVSEGLGKLFGK